MDRITESYLKYYSDKSCDGCNRTNNLIKDYQQELSSNDYGYINLAKFIETKGTTDCLREGFKPYYYYLSELEKNGKLHEFEAFKYLNNESLQQLSPLKVKVNSKEYEPNQKWHLIVSYLGMNVFLKCRTSIHSVICPELWMWMFETSDDIFNEKELDDIYNKAIEFKLGKIDKNEWKDYIKPYRQRLHSAIMDC